MPTEIVSNVATWQRFLETFGLPTVLTLFFVGILTYQTWKREMRLSSRIDKLEDFQMNQLTALVKESMEVMAEVRKAVSDLATAVHENSQMMMTLTYALKSRPCLSEDIETVLERRESERRKP